MKAGRARRTRYYLVGPFPPPLGGVSVYSYRLKKKLESEGYQVEHIDFSKSSFWQIIVFCLRVLFDPRPITFYFNTAHGIKLTPLFVLRPFPSRIAFHDHGEWEIGTFSLYKKRMMKMLIAIASNVYLVGEHLKKYYDENGINLPPEKTEIRHAFLAPPLEEEQYILSQYPTSLFEFIESHKPLILANAFSLKFINGQDLYGLDLCIQLVKRVKKEYPNVGLIFALSDIGDVAYYEKIVEEVRGAAIHDNVYFLLGKAEMWPLFKMVDAFVRPTRLDSYGVSVAEAVYFGCPAIASDVCERPPGAITFRAGDVDDLVAKVAAVLASRAAGSRKG